MKAQIIEAPRWVAILPGAIIAFAVAQIAVVIGSLFAPVPDFDSIVEQLSVPVCFVYAGVYIAPRLKFVVALVLTTLLTGIMFVIVFLVLTGAYVPSYINKWWFLFTCVAGIVAPIWICNSLHHDEEGVLSD